jgi:hypothetical protein
MLGVVMEKSVHKRTVLLYSNDRREEEIVLKRFEKGPLSPEGTLWVAEHRGTEAFASELDKQRNRFTSEAVRDATKYLSAMRFIEMNAAFKDKPD